MEKIDNSNISNNKEIRAYNSLNILKNNSVYNSFLFIRIIGIHQLFLNFSFN